MKKEDALVMLCICATKNFTNILLWNTMFDQNASKKPNIKEFVMYKQHAFSSKCSPHP